MDTQIELYKTIQMPYTTTPASKVLVNNEYNQDHSKSTTGVLQGTLWLHSCLSLYSRLCFSEYQEALWIGPPHEEPRITIPDYEFRRRHCSVGWRL